jgi:hypothetical protein
VTVTGPITGGTHGRPFGTSVADLAAAGYVEEEYFLDGEATGYRFAPGAGLTLDGRWDVVPDATREFRTRLLVRRPGDPAAANRTVYLEWQNVSGGVDIDAAWIHNYEEILRSGYVWVGVSAQRAGVHGPPLIPGLSQPLTLWDPERYDTREIADDALSYDIFTQAARAVGPGRPGDGVDPLGGTPVARVLAAGQSQSAGRLATYVNAVHPLARAIDGFLISARGAWVAPLFGSGAMITREPARIRDDVDALVFRVNTEGEALSSYVVRQPDTDTYRYWEIAGSSHQSAYSTVGVDGLFARDLSGPSRVGALPDNDLPAHRAMNAALAHLDRWLRTGEPPPGAPLIDIGGDPVEVLRDPFGNATGGLRLPEVAVPLAQYGPFGLPTISHRLRGFTVRFDPALLRQLYPDRADYLAKYAAATDAALEAGWLLPADAEAGRRAAEAFDFPIESI